MALITAINAQAQVVPLRYLDEVFNSVTVDTSIVYAQNRSYFSAFGILDPLRMDVYRPAGDTATNRPVIILMHAGSFLPGTLTGFSFADRNENCLVEMCQRYAKRGYVAVSMSYRLGWNPSSTDFDVRSGTIINAVFRAMQDAKNCIRYFRNDVQNGSNQWGVDGNKFILGGSNSGAYVALAAGNLNKPAEIEIAKVTDINGIPYIDTTKVGNFEGYNGSQNHNNYVTDSAFVRIDTVDLGGGNFQYDSVWYYTGLSAAFNGVLALGGAVADTTIIEAGEPPVISFQGVNEGLTPFNTAVVVTSTFNPVIEVSGAGDYMPIVDNIGNNAVFSPNNFPAGPKNRHQTDVTYNKSFEAFYPFWGQAFEPWNWYNGTNPVFNANASQSKAMLYIDTIMGYSSLRLYKLLIDPNYMLPTDIREVTGKVEMSVFPNPTSGTLHVVANSLQKPIETISLFDITGRLAKQLNGIGEYNQTIFVNDLHTGVYMLTVKLTDGNTATQRVVVE